MAHKQTKQSRRTAIRKARQRDLIDRSIGGVALFLGKPAREIRDELDNRDMSMTTYLTAAEATGWTYEAAKRSQVAA